MRSFVCALVALSSFAVAEAQSGAPLHHAGKVVKNRYHRVGHKVRATGHYLGHGYRATKHYVGHKYRGVKKAIKN